MINNEEARNILYRIIRTYAFEKEHYWLEEHMDSLLKYLKQSTTLGEFLGILGIEEGIEYDTGLGYSLRLVDENLFCKMDGDEFWTSVIFQWNEDNIKRFRDAKKVVE